MVESLRAALGSLIERFEATVVRSGSGGAQSAAQKALDNTRAMVANLERYASSGDGLAAISDFIAAAQDMAEDVERMASAESNQSIDRIVAAAEASHRAVASAMEYTHSLNLLFASRDDERAYRDREAERSAYIAAQQGKHTPEGDLNAAGATVGQMADAHAHGASGREFDTRWNALVESTAKLREAVRQQGGSTQEFDDHLRADLRRIMKAKGLSDAEIDARFAANPDPLEAAKAVVSNEDVERISKAALGSTSERPIADQTATDRGDKNDAIEKLRSAGITLTDHSPDQAFDPGNSYRTGLPPAQRDLLR